MAKYKCENAECKKSFTTNRGLASHKRMHKPSNCVKDAVDEAMDKMKIRQIKINDPYINTFKDNLKSKVVMETSDGYIELDKGWGKHWRSDKGVMEDICKHGVGHEEGIHGCDGCCAEIYGEKLKTEVELPEISAELNETLDLIDNLMSDVAKQHSIQVQTRLEIYIKPRAWYIPEWLYNLVIKKHVHVTDHGTTVQLKENK